ncbi:YitT family protein [Catenisphaera adipataccumulans]|jgi:uncharacterized membrane-anchored protein YitT (DUF2179 family)|uniref:Uncharacterized membrane-anchored protein YitT (DUF2179 family) n=1 Tax=Catenisphaera adipataccumulans TaxID=700500 RepID=A0A7W8FVQ0_9FIRM|nr:YitT family protein [Catenisphaera adipataccumulans]MBB5183383.1 uncharacterized membrane-anchored protein YitT (DUF2179 family) [Catenisphaera adipataccumulans]
MKPRDVIRIVFGNFLVAVATWYFVIPNDILNGGTAGLAIALKPVLHTDTVLMNNLFTIVFFAIGALTLGRRFAARSLLSSISYPVMLTVLSAVMQPAEEMPMYIAAIYSGVLSGIGLGLVFRTDASTGGMDVPALILAKYTNMKSGDAIFLVDALVVLLGVFTYGIVPALIGIIAVYVTGAAVNRTVLLGAQPAKNVMIVSDDWQEIETTLMKKVNRGVTRLSAQGGYTKKERPVLMCVIRQKQYPQLEEQVRAIDPHAFIIVNDVHRVEGEGFSENI